MLLFGLGGLFYGMLSVLLVNAIAVLSEDRFLARIGWGQSAEPGFGGVQDTQSVKAKLINLIASVRTLMRIPLIGINTMVILYELILG
ncbi:Yos1-like protein [Macrophomina phaseolina MS6]|uniref:Yos1-like protein n=1 Tax=Macrophomina phaseolina (strain MS6) TaxID=1126212 RepID=K2RHN6_MACPH|nr:Yos1-like protein [Macrophomina phaseolina MS6]